MFFILIHRTEAAAGLPDNRASLGVGSLGKGWNLPSLWAEWGY